MAKFRERNLLATLPFFASTVKEVELPKDGLGRWIRLAVRGTWTYDYTSTAPTLATTPPASLSFINLLKLSRNPESFAGPMILQTVPIWLLHLLAIPFLRRTPKATNPAFSTSDADFVTYSELFIPLSLLDGIDTALPTAGRTSWTLSVSWPSAAAAMVAMVGGSTVATVVSKETDPIRIEVTVGDMIPEAGDHLPVMEIGLRYDRLARESANMSKPVSVAPGEVPILHVISSVDNSIFAAIPGAPTSRIQWAYGQTEPLLDYTPSELQTKNASDYGLRDGDGYGNAYFIDLARLFGGVDKIPMVASQGGVPQITLQGATLTGVGYLDVLSIVGRWTEFGRSLIAA